MFWRSLFVLLYFFFWQLCCLFFFDIWFLITSLWNLQTLLDISLWTISLRYLCLSLCTKFHGLIEPTKTMKIDIQQKKNEFTIHRKFHEFLMHNSWGLVHITKPWIDISNLRPEKCVCFVQFCDCCLMPTQQFFSYIMARTSSFSMRWWWGPALC